MFDPFDFSDFGSPQRNGQTGHTAQTTVQPVRPESKLNTGFDPFGQSGPRQAPAVDAFGVTTPVLGQEILAVARPPLGLFGLAIALAGAGALIAGVWGGALVAAAVGWSLAGPVAIGVLAFYTLVDTRRRTDAVYSAPSWTGAAYWVVVAVCLSGIAIGAWHLALWAGRQ
jgi:hypothetical protein